MTVNEYKIKHATALKAFLSTEAGIDLIPTLHQLRPLFVTTSPHAHHESSGAVRGFEICEKAISFLSTPAMKNEEIEMTYGVEVKK